MTAFTPWRIAHVCHEANRALQVVNGDLCPSLPWPDEPEEVRRFAVAAVEFAMRGGTAEEQFRNWRDTKAAEGWTYGPVKDPQLKTHPCMVADYADLSEAQRMKDAVFAAVMRAMSGGGAAREPQGDAECSREDLEVTVREALDRAWRTAVAYLATDLAGRGVPLVYPEERAETDRVLTAADAWARTGRGPLLAQAQDAIAFERERADKAEAELAALADRLGAVIRSAVTAERERIREPVANFLAEYGDSQIPAFMVGQDLANAILKTIGPCSEEASGA